MSPAAAASAVPTRSQVQNWDTTALDDATQRWRGAAAAAETAFEQHRQNIASPGGTDWEGDAKDAALERVAADLGVVRRQGDVQRHAADVAARGSEDIAAARRAVLDAIAEAEADDFLVGEDLSVTDTREFDPMTAAARATAAAEHTEYIRWRAEQLVATDALVGQQLQAEALELQGIQFDGEGRDESIQIVDHKTDADGADSAQRPKTWQDMLRPPGSPTGEAPNGEANEAAEGVGGAPSSSLDDMLVPGKTTDPAQPANLDDALDEVAGQPVPAAAAAPRLNPAKVDKFKDLARKLMQQDGVPADQIEQRLDDMIAAAQQPLLPHTPSPQAPLPEPGFGEGFGDAWRSLEDTVHRLTGQEGVESFREAWKDLGTGLFETAKDPYATATRVVIAEAEAARGNPEYWLGGKTFDAAAAAATLPFGGEAALARGALDDAVRPGIPQEVIDTARAGQDPAQLPTPERHLPTTGNNYGLPPNAGDHHIAPTTDVSDHQAPIGPSLPQSIEDIHRWLPEINHGQGMDPFDPERAVNCGQCALAVDQRLTGIAPDASAGLGTLSIPEMEAATGLRQVPATPEQIEQFLSSQGPGAHTVVGVDRGNGFAGHWFNAYFDGTRVYAVDGQTGQIVGWPPDMDLPNGPVIAWDMGVPK